MNRNYAILALLLGVLGFSFKGIFIKLVFETGVDPIDVMGYRGIISLPFFLLACCIFREKQRLSLRSYMNIAATGVLFYIASLTDTLGLELVQVNVERVIMFTTPIFVLLISRVCMNKRYPVGIYLAVIISWAGVALSFASKEIEGGINILGMIYVTMSAASFAGCIIMISREVKNQNAVAFNAKLMVFCCVISLIPVLYKDNFDVTAIVPSQGNWVYPIMLAVFSTVLPSFLTTYGTKGCGEVVTAAFNNIGPFITMAAGVVILSEVLGPYDVIGAIVVASSIFYINQQMKVLNKR